MIRFLSCLRRVKVHIADDVDLDADLAWVNIQLAGSTIDPSANQSLSNIDTFDPVQTELMFKVLGHLSDYIPETPA